MAWHWVCVNEMAFFVRKERVSVPVRPEPLIQGKLTKHGGSHGGKANWKVRYCRLIEHTFFYCENERSGVCKGFVSMPGLVVREAVSDEAGGRNHCIHIAWPETDAPAFLIQVCAAGCGRHHLGG